MTKTIDSGSSTECSACGGELKPQTITYTQMVQGKLYLVTDVPALVCSRCGEVYLSPETVEALQKLIERGEAAATVEVPVFHFDQSKAA